MNLRIAMGLFACLTFGACFGTGTGGSGGNDDDTSPGVSPTPPLDPMQQNLNSSAGDYAYDFLRAGTFDRLLIEVDWVAGHAPSQSGLNALAAKLDELCFKPRGVEVLLDDQIPDQGGPEWTVREAQNLEVAWRDHYRDRDEGTAVMYFLYLDGNSALDSDQGRVLGFAYRGSSMVMFDETMDSVSGGLLLQGDVEDVVLIHEAGHLLGLVDNGIPMQTDHRDYDHGKHDINTSCIMHWTVNSESIADILLNRVPDFDQNCRDDMRAAGGRP